MPHAALGLALLALALSGCAVSSGATRTEVPTPSTTASASPVATQASVTALGLCETFGEKFLEYPDYVLALTNGDTTQQAEYYAWAQSLIDAAPADAADIVTRLVSPVTAVQEVIDAGGGELNLSTTEFKNATLEILDYCVEAGYRINQ